MVEFPDFYVFGLIDGNGEVQRDVCTNRFNMIDIEGHFPDDHPESPGEPFCFESDAYNLKDWAEANGMKSFKYGYKFDQLGEPWKVYHDVSPT